jgi:hypothetical protein
MRNLEQLDLYPMALKSPVPSLWQAVEHIDTARMTFPIKTDDHATCSSADQSR